MKRKTELPDLPGRLLFCSPFFDSPITEGVPGFYIRQHMEKVIVNIVRLQPFQMFGEILI